MPGKRTRVSLLFGAMFWLAPVVTGNLCAQMVLARYEFEGGWGPAFAAPGIGAAEWTTTANRIDYLGGGGNPGGAAVARSWLGPRNDGKYFSFEIANLSAEPFLLSQLSFDLSNSPPGIGPQGWALVSSAEGFASDLAAGSLEFAFAPWRTVNVPLTVTLDPDSKIEFRLIAWGANSIPPQGGHLHVDNVLLSGVPEPSTYALLAMSAAGALWWSRRLNGTIRTRRVKRPW
jgi:hypothetical protein